MRVGNFSVIVPEGREHGSGHVGLRHGSVYQIRCLNHWHDRRCDAEVTVDGKILGSYRLDASGTITLERSYLDNGRFTFFRADSPEGQAVLAGEVTPSNRGLIQVTFRPEYKPLPVFRKAYFAPYPNMETPTYPPQWKPEPLVARGMSTNDCNPSSPQFVNCSAPVGASAGVTGLTGHSDQSFVTVSNLNYDLSGEVVITLRLVCEESTPSEPRPLRPVNANPVPSAVG